MPIEKQFRNWSELNSKPFNKEDAHPYTKCRGILMNGIETEAAIFLHQFARHTKDIEVKRNIALSRRIEQQQQKAVNWCIPGNQSVLETTIGYEQVAVDLTAWMCQNEPDPYVKKVFDFGLLEDFDHLYRYANLLEMKQGIKAEKLVGKYTEVMPGRPTAEEHRHPFDDIRNQGNRKKMDPQTLMNVLTLVAGEQQTMNFYMNVGNTLEDSIGRGLYLEIGQIEEQHVTQYESLLDPSASWYEMLVMHEYNECYLYHAFMEQEVDPAAKKLWELHLSMELEHFRIACDMLQKYDKKDAEELLPNTFPKPITFESNVDYVRDVLRDQVELTAQETEFVPKQDLKKDSRYMKTQNILNTGTVPSEQVIKEHVKKQGTDYRYLLKGEHPVERLREAA
jgi:rubrerythrin